MSPGPTMLTVSGMPDVYLREGAIYLGGFPTNDKDYLHLLNVLQVDGLAERGRNRERLLPVCVGDILLYNGLSFLERRSIIERDPSHLR